MGRYLPAHQYKLGNKTIGLTQADNYAFALVVESAKKKTFKEILEYYEANFIKSPDVHNLEDKQFAPSYSTYLSLTTVLLRDNSSVK